jgi:hypothetical protein
VPRRAHGPLLCCWQSARSRGTNAPQAAGVPGSAGGSQPAPKRDLTHGAVALVHRSGHPFASHVEKLVSNFLIGCQVSKPHAFARVVHAFLVGSPQAGAGLVSQRPAPGLGTRAHVASFMMQGYVVATAERCSGA